MIGEGISTYRKETPIPVSAEYGHEAPVWARIVLKAVKRGMLAFISDIEPLIAKNATDKQ